jgi:hypothetical protein
MPSGAFVRFTLDTGAGMGQITLPEGRAAKREDALLEHISKMRIEREALLLEVAILRAQEAINRKKKRNHD